MRRAQADAAAFDAGLGLHPDAERLAAPERLVSARCRRPPARARCIRRSRRGRRAGSARAAGPPRRCPCARTSASPSRSAHVASGLDETPFERGCIDLRQAAARRRRDHEMQPRQRGFVEMRRLRGEPSREGIHEQRRHVVANGRAAAILRHVDEAAYEPSIRIAAEEQRDSLPLLQAENSHRRREQRLVIELEQFVMREAVEDVAQRLAVVAPGRESRTVEHRRSLLRSSGLVSSGRV